MAAGGEDTCVREPLHPAGEPAPTHAREEPFSRRLDEHDLGVVAPGRVGDRSGRIGGREKLGLDHEAGLAAGLYGVAEPRVGPRRVEMMGPEVGEGPEIVRHPRVAQRDDADGDEAAADPAGEGGGLVIDDRVVARISLERYEHRSHR